jgi:hypothetical protein
MFYIKHTPPTLKSITVPKVKTEPNADLVLFSRPELCPSTLQPRSKAYAFKKKKEQSIQNKKRKFPHTLLSEGAPAHFTAEYSLPIHFVHKSPEEP